MSREVRTSMAAILDHTNVTARLRPRYRLPTLHPNGGRLMTLLDDVFDLSKIEAGAVIIEHLACESRRLIEDVVVQ